ncbi:hypothetical protein FRC12_001633 [Ceratobasidium sp. 428]|nr:hypothetical protein FRC12_001633 [Ceratobasidium sp. 428]
MTTIGQPTLPAGEQSAPHYCSICEDGDRLIECAGCGLSCCVTNPDEDDGEDFDAESNDSNAPDEPAGSDVRPDALPNALHDANDRKRNCITLPDDFERLEYHFWCPDCLEQSPHRPINYVINRGIRATQRRVNSSQVVLIINYLPKLEQRCRRIFNTVMAVLGAFHVVVSSYYVALPMWLAESDSKGILKQVPPSKSTLES